MKKQENRVCMNNFGGCWKFPGWEELSCEELQSHKDSYCDSCECFVEVEN